MASGIWTFQQLFWLARLGRQNLRTISSRQMSILTRPSREGATEAIEVTITLRRPWDVNTGGYVYITVPSLARRHGGFLQAHPYIIAWAEGADITLLIQRQSGFSNDMFTSPAVSTSRVVVDGPYGHAQPLLRYDKVLFVANGIGIAAHLLPIRSLLEAHENQTARVRRITLVWFLETAGQSYCPFPLGMNTNSRRARDLGITIPSSSACS
jgi:predicted ferric reductase